MRTVLFLTDFSIRADHVAHYALKFAQSMNADLLLCNVFLVSSDDSVLSQGGVEGEGLRSMEEDSNYDLDELSKRLERDAKNEFSNTGFIPCIKYCSRSGLLATSVNSIAAEYNIVMAVISMHDAGMLSTLLLGDHVESVIDEATCPLLVVPEVADFRELKKIAFATDLNQGDIQVIHSLAELAKYTNAEILVIHVTEDRQADLNDHAKLSNFINLVSTKINYDRIYYRSIENDRISDSLNDLLQQPDVDILAVVHRKRNFFQKLFKGSVTQKLADHLSKPLFIFPRAKETADLPVF